MRRDGDRGGASSKTSARHPAAKQHEIDDEALGKLLEEMKGMLEKFHPKRQFICSLLDFELMTKEVSSREFDNIPDKNGPFRHSVTNRLVFCDYEGTDLPSPYS